MKIVPDNDSKMFHIDSSLVIHNEIVKLCHELYELNNKIVTYIEIGIYYGGTFKEILQRCEDIKIKGIGIDLFEDFDIINGSKINTHSDAEVVSLKGLTNALKNININNFKLLKGDSVKMLNSLKKIDNVVCFIDGNHTYEAVKSDFYAALNKITSGYIILDDVHVTGNGYGINQFFEEIQNEYPIMFHDERNVIFKIN